MSLRDYKGEKVAIWLAYFLASSRGKGRKVKKIGEKRIDFNSLLVICQKLGLDPVPFPDKIHPATGIPGLIMVNKIEGKYKIIKMIMKEILK
ncbi:hypothetical protein EWF20_01845 [Sulfolobus sp. S-194]|uniref:hypothetical protein n=1 Tax=Sulfolobus sp. S-194 TaxID=2512240 RepID=UPI0014370C3E|nr:hypothetical protein [Sulfolobus sp. S-194]QIW23020.1 hypothetical protein EWF20_01845 [Sulfolobus sp. S-194]